MKTTHKKTLYGIKRNGMPDAFNLEITKIDNTVVEGKFTGTLVIGSGLTTLEAITVENGSFSAPFK